MATKKRGRILKAFKREVAIEYIQGGGTMQEIALKYNLPNLQTVSNWVRCYLKEAVEGELHINVAYDKENDKLTYTKDSPLGI